MTFWMVWADASVDPQTRQGVGGHLVLTATQFSLCQKMTLANLHANLLGRIRYHDWPTHKSTLAEIQTAIWSIESLFQSSHDDSEVHFHSDCQSFVDLWHGRLQRLAQRAFCTKSGPKHQHAELYRELAQLQGRYPQVQVHKIKGHSQTIVSTEGHIFCYLDRSVRRKLRELRLSPD